MKIDFLIIIFIYKKVEHNFFCWSVQYLEIQTKYIIFKFSQRTQKCLKIKTVYIYIKSGTGNGKKI